MASIFWSAGLGYNILVYTPNISAFYITPIKKIKIKPKSKNQKKKPLLHNPNVLMSLYDFIPVITDTHTHTNIYIYIYILNPRAVGNG